MPGLHRISLHGFKSIELLENFEIRPLHILIGANGSGKSNFPSFFSLLCAMCDFSLSSLSVSSLANYVAVFDGSDTLLFNGSRQPRALSVPLRARGRAPTLSLSPQAIKDCAWQAGTRAPFPMTVHSLLDTRPDTLLARRIFTTGRALCTGS